jgi:uncharacterized protein YuzE
MDAFQWERANKLVEELREAGTNCGLLLSQGAVILRSAGSPHIDTPTFFDEDDLNNAVKLDLIEKGNITGAYFWEWYVLKKKRC